MEEKIGPCPLGYQCEDIDTTGDKPVLVRCPWHVKIRGKDPQSEQEIDEYRCAISWMPVLQVEHSLFERQTGAAVESMRNVVVEKQERTITAMALLAKLADPKLIDQR